MSLKLSTEISVTRLTKLWLVNKMLLGLANTELIPKQISFWANMTQIKKNIHI